MRTVAEASIRKVPSTRVVVKTGDVDDEVEALARKIGASAIVLGAPIDIGGTSVEELMKALRSRTGVDVSIVDPDAPPLV